MAEGGWFYLHPAGQTFGPYSEPALQDLLAQGYVLPDTHVWKEGRSEWLPVSAVPELQAMTEAAAAAAAAARPSGGVASAAAGAAAAAGSVAPPRKGAQLSSAPATLDPLAQFKAEISALEGEGDPAVLEDAPPSPEERRFVDDDGTSYAWDSRLRKFVEEGAGQLPQYDAADMVFDVEPEVIPEFVKPGAEYSSDEELAEELEEGAKGGKWKKGKKGKGKGKGGDKGGEEEGAGAVGAAGDAAGANEAAGEAGPSNGAAANGGSGKRARDQGQEAGGEGEAKKAKGEEKPEGWFELKVNTSVYVTGLPEDVTEDELAAEFSKCGLIKEGEGGRPRVKVYRDKATGLPKGDGLVTYLKEPSVVLALQILDGAPLRPGDRKPMSVTLAKFEQKGERYVSKRVDNKSKKKKKGNKVEQALGWGGFDDKAKPTEVTVVLKHMFSPEEIVADPDFKTDLETDVAGECVKLGSIAAVRVYQHHPEGAISVKFNAPDAAQQCIKLMQGRFFGGRQVEAALWDGVTNYNVKPQRESEEEQQRRLDLFAAELEGGDQE